MISLFFAHRTWYNESVVKTFLSTAVLFDCCCTRIITKLASAFFWHIDDRGRCLFWFPAPVSLEKDVFYECTSFFDA